MGNLVLYDWSVQFNAPPEFIFSDVLVERFELRISIKLFENFLPVNNELIARLDGGFVYN